MKIDPHYQRQNCSPMILVSGNIRFSAHGRQTAWLSTTIIFGNLGGYFFGNVRDKASNITCRASNTDHFWQYWYFGILKNQYRYTCIDTGIIMDVI